MGKFLRVLVVFLLLFSIGSLVLGIMLFNKREILKGRTQKLEQTIEALGATIEDTSTEEQASSYTGRDISEVSANASFSPEYSEFWQNYKGHLELQDQPMLDLSSDDIKLQLKQYYQIDAATLKVAHDPVNGLPLTKGAGTMQSVLTDLITKSGEQLGRLNETRQQLSDIREELVIAITELNTHKSTLRQRLADIFDLNDKVTGLETQIAQLRTNVQTLEDTKEVLETQVADLTAALTETRELLAEEEQKTAGLITEINRLRNVDTISSDHNPDITIRESRIERGTKGSVSTADSLWNFVVIKLQPEFMAQLVATEEMPALLPFDLFIRRPDKSETFVTKISIIQIKPDQGIAIADVLSDWSQLPVQEGDVVFY